MSDTLIANSSYKSNDVLHERPATDPLFFASESRDADVLSLVDAGLAAGRAQLAYQPVVLAKRTNDITFYEGLIRVKDDAGRIIPTRQFMPLVEQTVLGRRIDTVALDLALRQLHHDPNLRLSINVSARSLGDGQWRKTLETGLMSQGNLRDRLIFEISESSAMFLHEVVIRFMQEMQPRGIGFALDGFGAGMTAFRYLRDFLFDLVKIDKSFAAQIATDPDNQVLAEALITVAHQFEMFAIADGIEAAEDARFFREIGADCLQGYHIGLPRFNRPA